MKAATLLMTLSSELVYSFLMFVTWVVLLGWAAALISACTLAFRNRDEDDEEVAYDSSRSVLPPATSSSRRSPTPMGFGL